MQQREQDGTKPPDNRPRHGHSTPILDLSAPDHRSGGRSSHRSPRRQSRMSHGHYSDRIPYSGHVLSASMHLPRDSRHQLRAPSQTSITPNEQRRRTRITPRAPLDNPVSSRSTLHDVSASAPSEGPSRGHGRQPRRPLPAVPNKPAAPPIGTCIATVALPGAGTIVEIECYCSSLEYGKQKMNILIFSSGYCMVSFVFCNLFISASHGIVDFFQKGVNQVRTT